MATFEACLDSLNDFYKLLETFNDAAVSMAVAPVDNEIPPSGYSYLVALGRELDDTEKELFPSEFNGVPVKSYVVSPGWRDRRGDLDFDPE